MQRCNVPFRWKKDKTTTDGLKTLHLFVSDDAEWSLRMLIPSHDIHGNAYWPYGNRYSFFFSVVRIWQTCLWLPCITVSSSLEFTWPLNKHDFFYPTTNELRRHVRATTMNQIHNNFGQVVHTPAPLPVSLSNINWYQCQNLRGQQQVMEEMWFLSSTTLGVWAHSRQGDKHVPHIAVLRQDDADWV